MENENTAKIVLERLSYNPESGNFRWAAFGRGISYGKIAGTIEKTGYVKIMVNRKAYLAHRLAWLMCHGEWPDGIIDHIDGNPSNNKICNLRMSSASFNAANAKRPVTNTSGFKGVSWSKLNKKWYASIKVNGKSKNLGLFDCPKSAHEVYLKAACQYFGKHARAS